MSNDARTSQTWVIEEMYHAHWIRSPAYGHHFAKESDARQFLEGCRRRFPQTVYRLQEYPK